LIHENAPRGRVARVYVELHNRGLNQATNVAVKVFFADASVGLPDLPTGFWTNFPNNVLPAASPWKQIAPHKVVPSVESGRAQVVGFEWAVPATAAGHTCLLAIATAPNDPVGTTERVIALLVPGNKKCGLKNLTVVDPPPTIGPWVASVLLYLWRAGKWPTYEIGLDRRPGPIVSGIVLSKRLSEIARSQKIERTKLTDAQLVEIKKQIKQRPELEKLLDLTSAYRPPQKPGSWLRSVPLTTKRPEPMVVLVAPKPRPGLWSIVQWAADGTVVGGFTLQARGQQQG
jgi:hypothetical protein